LQRKKLGVDRRGLFKKKKGTTDSASHWTSKSVVTRAERHVKKRETSPRENKRLPQGERKKWGGRLVGELEEGHRKSGSKA